MRLKLLSCLLLALSPSFLTAAPAKPKLLVVLVIDQFRADLLQRYEKRFLPAKDFGFRYLMEKGAYYPFGQYDVLQNMTCPGHATILTGAYPYQNGIPNNDWIDRKTGERVYCIHDDKSPVLGAKDAGKKGASPRQLVGSTVGDELKNSGYQSRVITMALKDRSAVMLGGHRADLALWFDQDNMAWTTSTYYAKELPDWVKASNEKLKPRLKENLTWEAKGPSETSQTQLDPADVKVLAKDFGETFPRSVPASSKSALMFPFGTEIVVDNAIDALKHYNLGKGPAPDILAVSLSNHDTLSHMMGPNSREVEELTVSEDKEIGRLLSAVDKAVGLENTVIVLTADHGAVPSPNWLKSMKFPAGTVDEKGMLEKAEAHLGKVFGPLKNAKYIWSVSELSFFLNHGAIASGKAGIEKVRAELSSFLKALNDPGVAHVFTMDDVHRRTLPPSMHERQILKTFVDERSADVTIIVKPYYIVNYSYVTTTHMTGYSYDRTVPIILAGPSIVPGRYAEKAEVVDIAPTLSFLLGTIPPSGSEGRVLSESLKRN